MKNYSIYYNDNVNEPAMLGSAATLDEAKAIAEREAEGYEPVHDGDTWTCLPPHTRRASRSMRVTSPLS